MLQIEISASSLVTWVQNQTKIAPETDCNVITGATMANGLEKLCYREKSEVFIQILEGMKQTPVIVLS